MTLLTAGLLYFTRVSAGGTYLVHLLPPVRTNELAASQPAEAVVQPASGALQDLPIAA